jgi:hypothetical protein
MSLHLEGILWHFATQSNMILKERKKEKKDHEPVQEEQK